MTTKFCSDLIYIMLTKINTGVAVKNLSFDIFKQIAMKHDQQVKSLCVTSKRDKERNGDCQPQLYFAVI
jgi:hypothetical protein